MSLFRVVTGALATSALLAAPTTATAQVAGPDGHLPVSAADVAADRAAVDACVADKTKCASPNAGYWLIKDWCGFTIPMRFDDDVIRGERWHRGSVNSRLDDAANGVRSLCMQSDGATYKKLIPQKIKSIHLTWGHQCDLPKDKGADSQTPACRFAGFALANGVLTVEIHEVNPTFGTWGDGAHDPLNTWLVNHLK